jgi:uncharacterized OB-fold protein
MGTKAAQRHLPRIFYVNWFRKDDDGRFLWPGYGENSRVLAWIFDRCAGTAEAVDTPIGRLPAPLTLDTDGLDLGPGVLNELLRVDVEAWRDEVASIETHYATFGDRLPATLQDQLTALDLRLKGKGDGLPFGAVRAKQIPVVNYLGLEGGRPHLFATECSNCGALYFGRRNACSRCFQRDFLQRRLADTGTLRAFSIIQRAAPGVKAPYISALVDLDGGGSVKANLLNTATVPEAIKLGMPVRLTTYTVATDDDGSEAVAFGYEPA